MEMAQVIPFHGKASKLPHEDDDLENGITDSNPDSYAVGNHKNVLISVEKTCHTSGSSAITTSNITNYPWDSMYIPGNLVSVHHSGSYIAYAIVAPSLHNGIVRIISRKSGIRSIIKNITGLVKDIAFSFLADRVVLAFVNQFCTLYVYEIIEEEKIIRTNLLLEVERKNEVECDFQRVIWCPYIPYEQNEEDEYRIEEDCSYLLVTTNGASAEIWHIGILLKTLGNGLISRSDATIGPYYQIIEKHEKEITDAAFSPDGTALATASLDGSVKFFQVYMETTDEEQSPRCLHEWKPHDGNPLSSLFFLDNRKNRSPDIAFWKYAITGAYNNSEIKVWSCQTWKCHQILKFEMSLDEDETKITLKAAIDQTSRYLILSDIQRRVLYVMMLNDYAKSLLVADKSDVCDSAKSKEEYARIVSVTELPVQYPVIFLCITDADWKPYKIWKLQQNEEDDYLNEKEDCDIVTGLVTKCVLITTKSLQDATIRFQPALPQFYGNYADDDRIDFKNDSTNGLKDELSDVNNSFSLNGKVENSFNAEKELETNFDSSLSEYVSPMSSRSKEVESANSTLIFSSPQNDETPATNPRAAKSLLTPESFSSPIRIEDDMAKQDSVEKSTEDFKAAALSLLREVSEKTIETPKIALDADNQSAAIPGVASSSSRSSPTNKTAFLPMNKILGLAEQEAPLATSELAKQVFSNSIPENNSNCKSDVNNCPAAVSSSSSPSLEVQQILHSHSNSLNESNSPDPELAAQFHHGPVIADKSNHHGVRGSSQSLSHQKIDIPVKDDRIRDPYALLQSLRQSATETNDSINFETSICKDSPGLVSALDNMKICSEKKISVPISKSNILMPSVFGLGATSGVESLRDRGLSHVTCEELESEIRGVSPNISKDNALKNSVFYNDVDKTESLDTKLDSGSTTDLINLGPQMSSRHSSVSKSIKIENYKKSEEKFVQDNLIDKPCLTPDVQNKATVVTVVDSEFQQKMLDEFNSLHDFVNKSNEEISKSSKATFELANALSKQVENCVLTTTQIKNSLESAQKSQNKFQDRLPQIITNATRGILEDLVKQEIRNSLGSSLNKCMEPLRNQINAELRGMVANSETNVINTLSKSITSKHFVDNFTGQVANALSSSVQTASKDCYNKVVIPGFNTITQQVFAQLNETFNRGTKEYVQHVENELQSTRNTLLNSVTATADRLEKNKNEFSTNVNLITDLLKKNIDGHKDLSNFSGDNLKKIMREEVTKALHDHQAVVEARTSRAPTPAISAQSISPKVSRQHIQQFISQGQFNSAFREALSATDLSLLVYVCERINPQQLFKETPCPLSQEVLLSLCNQLSHDLSTFTDLKIKYLEEAIVNLDTSHHVTQEHLPHVLFELQKSLNSHIERNPGQKKLKIILMAINNLANE